MTGKRELVDIGNKIVYRVPPSAILYDTRPSPHPIGSEAIQLLKTHLDMLSDS